MMSPRTVERLPHGTSLLPPGSPNHPKVKCVLVGDGAIGKTSLIVSYTTNGYPTEYVPTAFDNYSVVVTVDQKPIRLQLCDTAGQDDFDSLRPLCYPNTDIFLVCFSVVSPTSFHNVREKWLTEIRQHCPKAPIVLVGNQCDLRNDVKILIELANYNERPVTENEARQLVRDTSALAYIECSALTQKNLKEVFDSAILAALEKKGLLKKSRKKKKKGKKEHQSPDVEGWRRTTPERDEKRSKSGFRKLCCFL